MAELSHYQKLEGMYLRANVNTMLFDTTTIQITEDSAEIGLTVDEKYFHGLGAIHGAVYFKLLDDAAFSFNLNIVRPVNAGKIRAVGKVKFQSRSMFVAEATAYNEAGKMIAFGTGNFVKSKQALSPEIGYR